MADSSGNINMSNDYTNKNNANQYQIVKIFILTLFLLWFFNVIELNNGVCFNKPSLPKFLKSESYESGGLGYDEPHFSYPTQQSVYSGKLGYGRNY